MATDLEKKIQSDLIEAVKKKEGLVTETLRMLIAGIHNKSIEKKGKGGSGDLIEEEVLDVLLREAKKRKEAERFFSEGGRIELAEKEARELNVLERYLPKQFSREEIEDFILKAIEKIKPQGAGDFGKIMGETMKSLKGRADASLVGEIIKEKLN